MPKRNWSDGALGNTPLTAARLNQLEADGVDGTYSGTASTEFPGSVDSYTVTRAGDTTTTFTQPAVTRNATTGAIINRPPITVS